MKLTDRTGKIFDDGRPGNEPDREITIGIETSYNLPSPAEIQVDIEKLKSSAENRKQRIRGFRREIKGQLKEQKELLELVKNPGIYNPVACKDAAERCNKHIRMFEATIKKEQVGVDQLERMIEILEERRCLSERILQSTGKGLQG